MRRDSLDQGPTSRRSQTGDNGDVEGFAQEGHKRETRRKEGHDKDGSAAFVGPGTGNACHGGDLVPVLAEPDADGLACGVSPARDEIAEIGVGTKEGPVHEDRKHGDHRGHDDVERPERGILLPSHGFVEDVTIPKADDHDAVGHHEEGEDEGRRVAAEEGQDHEVAEVRDMGDLPGVVGLPAFRTFQPACKVIHTQDERYVHRKEDQNFPLLDGAALVREDISASVKVEKNHEGRAHPCPEKESEEPVLQEFDEPLFDGHGSLVSTRSRKRLG